jgi:hypothetical protein
MKTSIFYLIIISSLTLFSCTNKENSNNPQSPNSGVELSGDKVWRFGEGQVNGNLDFGTVDYGKNKLVTLVIKNDGVSTIVSPPTVSGDFQIVYQNNCVNLIPGNSCLVKILFSGGNKSPGVYTGELTFENYSGLLSAVIGSFDNSNALSLRVNSAEVTDTLDFGALNYRESIIKTLVVKNNGSYNSEVDLSLPSNNFTSVFNSCEGRNLAPKTSCLIKMFLSGQGKEGSLNEQLIFDGREISVVAEVESRNDSVENNSNIVLLVDNNSLEFSSTADLGTLNLNSKITKNLFLKNNGNEDSPLLNVFISDAQILINQCNTVLRPTQSCRIMISLPTDVKETKQLFFDVSGYSSMQSYFLEYIVRSPGDTIDCSDGLDFVTQAEITWDGSSYSSCQVLDCLTGYHIENNSCTPNILSINISQPDSGRGIISGPTSIAYGSNATFTYTGNTAYVLDAWQNVCTSVSGNTCTINNITSNQSISALVKCSSTHSLANGECLRTINLAPSSTTNYNIYSAASNPTDKVVVNVTVGASVILGSNSTTTPALTTGSGWVAGSVINLINNGTIVGKGGNGGYGSEWSALAEAGYPGGNAIEMFNSLVITNNGIIGGGGGGGGGGSGFSNGWNYCRSGGGGGGGAGNIVGSGGSFATCGGRPYDNPGSSGTLLLGGNGGPLISDGTRTSGAGGKGGDLGQNGSAGGQSFGSGSNGLPLPGQGGIAGKAIITNGNTINWISGNEPAKVKGLIQ